MIAFPNKTVWLKYNKEELEELSELVFQHYRTVGYPHYVYDDAGKLKQLRRLEKADHSKLDGSGFGAGYVGQSMVGLGLAWSYHPHAIDVRCNGMRTVRETFEADEIFRKALAKRLKHGTHITDSEIRKAVRTFTGTQAASNFRPVAAASLYHEFCPKGGTVYDPSAGYSGRLLGAWACNHVAKYIGCDPCTKTFMGLQDTADDLWRLRPERELWVEIHPVGSEDFVPECESVDCIMTSPPYLDLERYSNEPTQSWKRYPTREAWMEGFMKRTLINCRVAAKPHAMLVLNIAEDMVADVKRIASEVGWGHEQSARLMLSAMMGTRKDESHKYEPILVFKKKP